MKEKQTAGRRQLEEFAPEFARYNDDILFGEVWAKEDHLTDKTRSIITISALISGGNLEQLENKTELLKKKLLTLSLTLLFMLDGQKLGQPLIKLRKFGYKITDIAREILSQKPKRKINQLLNQLLGE